MLTAAGLWIAVLGTGSLLSPERLPNSYTWDGGRAFLPMFLPYFLGLAGGVWVLTDHYLSSPSPIQRTQARFLLAAYLLKCGTYLEPELASALLGLDAKLQAPAEFAGLWPQYPAMAIFTAAIAGFLFALALRRVRERRMPDGDDAFLLAAIVAGFAIGPLFAQEVEFMLVRPLLITYALLRYQMLDLDLREHRATVVGVVVAGMASVHLVVVHSFDEFGAGADLSTGLGVVAVLTLGGLLAFPLLRVLLVPPSQGASAAEPRARDLYRAALEGVVADGDSTSGANVLRTLRDRLGISEREHASMEASVRRAFARPAKALEPGARFLERYRVERLLGEGGFGRTFLALDEATGRKVVLKAARADSPDEGRRMLREAKHLAQLQHPNIVTLYDVERVGDDVVLVLEYVEGGSLAERLGRGALEPDDAVRVIDDVLAALEAAHAEDVLHRDVKPANILLTKEGRAKLADFGVARAPAGAGTASGFSLTGVQPGSVHTMSPEQVRGMTLDARSDLYSAGAVLYECLSGKPYLDFRGRLDFDARIAVLEQKPRLPLPGVARRLNDLLRDLLAKDRAARPKSAGEARRLLLPRPNLAVG